MYLVGCIIQKRYKNISVDLKISISKNLFFFFFFADYNPMELASHDQQGFFSSASSRNSVLTSNTLLSLIIALPAFIHYFWALRKKSCTFLTLKNKQTNNSKIPSVIKTTTTNTKKQSSLVSPPPIFLRSFLLSLFKKSTVC